MGTIMDGEEGELYLTLAKRKGRSTGPYVANLSQLPSCYHSLWSSLSVSVFSYTQSPFPG